MRTISRRNESSLSRRLGLLRWVVTLLFAVVGVVTAYHTTIYGLREEVAAKADSGVVSEIDSRLIRIETILTETVATREQLLSMRDELNARLIIIETELRRIP